MHIRRIEACPACGSADAAPVARLNGTGQQRFLELSERKYGGLMNTWLTELEVVICKCGGCGHHWYRDQPGEKELARLYEAGRPLLEVDARGPAQDYSPHMLAEMRVLRRLATRAGEPVKPTLLDYGSGFGRWARAAAAAGFEVTAYEPSLARADRAVESFPTEHDESQLRGRVFDIINVEQVLEHVAAPTALLSRLGNLCHVRTIMRITVPNIERGIEGNAIWTEWPFNGERMHTMAPFEHLHGFTAQSLTILARNANFEVLPTSVLWKVHPKYALRRLLGVISPGLLPTKLFVRPIQ